MPCDYSKYPSDWKAVRVRTLEMAGHKCEWCGAPDRRVVVRNGSEWAHYMGYTRTSAGHITTIVLTTAHLGSPKPDGSSGDKTDLHDARPCNLAALCQWCHFWYDREQHKENSWKTRQEKTGQGVLF